MLLQKSSFHRRTHHLAARGGTIHKVPLQNRQRIVHPTVLQGSPTTSVSAVESTVTTEESVDLSKPKQKLEVKYLLSKFIYIDHPTHPVIEPSHSNVAMHSGLVKGRLKSCVAH